MVCADETSFQISEANRWTGVDPHLAATVYQIAPKRGRDAVLEMLEGSGGTLEHDPGDPWDAITRTDYPLDPVRGNRWPQKVEVGHYPIPRVLEGGATDVPPGGTSAGGVPPMGTGHSCAPSKEVRRTERHPQASVFVRARREARAARPMGRSLGREWRDEEAMRIADELGQRPEMLFTFGREPGTSWNSHGAEREVRVA